jgi:hypothetical protein
MTILNQTVSTTYNGNGATTTFTIPFTFFDTDEVTVTLIAADGTETLQVEGALQDYTLTGAVPPGTPLPTTVTMNVAPASGAFLRVKRVMELTQPVDITNSAAWDADSVEGQWDRTVAMIQGLDDKADRALTLAEGIDPDLYDLELPTPVANKHLGWNAAGDALENKDPANYWWNGSGDPNADSDLDDKGTGDLYLDNDTGDVYSKDSDAGDWTLVSNIQGADGSDGDDGANGELWFNGSGAPAGATGAVGDMYINNDNGAYYEKTGVATWALRGNLVGPAGDTGNGWLTGSGAPDGGDGDENDLYLDTDNGDVYQKGVLGWDGPIANLTGPSSPASAVTVTPTGNLAADDVQEALVELQTDIDTINTDLTALDSDLTTHIADTSTHGTTGAIVGTTDTQTLSAKTFSDSVTLAEIATPSTPASGFGKVYFKSDGKLYQLNDAGTEAEVGSGAGGGGINYFSANPDAETDVSGWSGYIDAAGASPVDGTAGGTPDITWTRTTSSPLRGTASFLFTKGAANRQGQGESFDFTLDAADQAKVQQIEFDYAVASGTYASGDLSVWIYDVTNAVMIQPAGYQILSATTDFPVRHVATFQTASNSTSYRFCIHTSSISASAYTVKFDNFSMGPQETTRGAPVTDWVSYTPTGSWVANSTYGGRWRRVGDEMEVQAIVSTSGAPTSAVLSVNLPTGYSIDTAKLASAAGSFILGEATYFDNTDVVFTGRIVYSTTTAVSAKYIINNDGANRGVYLLDVNATQPMTWASSDHARMNFRVPITGWSSSVEMSANTSTTVISFGAYRSGSSQTVSAGTPLEVVCNSERQDTADGYSTSTGRFTAPVPGWYSFSASAQIQQGATAASTMSAYIRKNGTGDQYSIATLDSLANSKIYTLTSNATIYLNSGEYVSFWVSSTTQNVTVLNTGATNDVTSFYGERKSGSSQIAASEFVHMRYAIAGANAIANASATIVNFSVKEAETHANTVTTGAGAWKFTAPVAGYYRVTSMVMSATGAGWTLGEAWDLTLYKGGAYQRTFARHISSLTHAGAMCAQGATTIWLNAQEYVDVRVIQNSGTDPLNTTSTDDYAWIEIEKVSR